MFVEGRGDEGGVGGVVDSRSRQSQFAVAVSNVSRETGISCKMLGIRDYE